MLGESRTHFLQPFKVAHGNIFDTGGQLCLVDRRFEPRDLFHILIIVGAPAPGVNLMLSSGGLQLLMYSFQLPPQVKFSLFCCKVIVDPILYHLRSFTLVRLKKRKVDCIK
jgi:hypothetical protein